MAKRKHHKKDRNEIKRICERAGIKLTAQRLAIYEELMTADGHPSAEEIYLRLQKKMPTIAVDTVYRTLATFDEIGIASKLHLANKRNLFDVNLAQHHHFVCDSCGGIHL